MGAEYGSGSSREQRPLINGSLLRVRARVGEPNKTKAAHDIVRSGFFLLQNWHEINEFESRAGQLFDIAMDTDRAYRRIVQLDVAEPTDPSVLERKELRIIWGRDVLQLEDITFIESALKGMSQSSFEHGWYMINQENEGISEVMLRHYHETYIDHMGEPK
jgi:hypothetical protein